MGENDFLAETDDQRREREALELAGSFQPPGNSKVEDPTNDKVESPSEPDPNAQALGTGEGDEKKLNTLTGENEEKAPVVDTAPVDDKIIHHIGGKPHYLSPKQNEEYLAKVQEVQEASGNLSISELPLSHPYWEKKRKLDEYLATLKN